MALGGFIMFGTRENRVILEKDRYVGSVHMTRLWMRFDNKTGLYRVGPPSKPVPTPGGNAMIMRKCDQCFRIWHWEGGIHEDHCMWCAPAECVDCETKLNDLHNVQQSTDASIGDSSTRTTSGR